MYYDSADDLLHGYANNIEKYFNSRMPTPDYSRTIIIAQESYCGTANYTYTGNALRLYSHNWVSYAVAPFVAYLDWNDDLSYKIPEDGYLIITISTESSFGISPYQTFDIFDGNTLVYSYAKDANYGSSSDSQTIPVAKGDIIHYGKLHQTHETPYSYNLSFTPKKNV